MAPPSEAKTLLSEKAVAAARGIAEAEAGVLAKKLAENGNTYEVLVAILDIRESTTLMLHVEDFREYAHYLAEFFHYVRAVTQQAGGWYDKFTGDGALVFWVVDENHKTTIDNAIQALLNFQIQFNRAFMARLRTVAGCIPTSCGLAIGADLGQCLLSDLSVREPMPLMRLRREGNEQLQVGDPIAVPPRPLVESVTVLGRPVVGAARMVAAASAHEVIANVRLGELARALVDPKTGLTVEPATVRNKDLVAASQHAFRIVHPFVLREVDGRMTDPLRVSDGSASTGSAPGSG